LTPIRELVMLRQLLNSHQYVAKAIVTIHEGRLHIKKETGISFPSSSTRLYDYKRAARTTFQK
jgi:hypothetical protein